MKQTPDTSDRDRLRELYDAAPYPESLAGNMPQGTPLITHWINAAVAPAQPALHPKANILVAGCGSGTEALELARQYPQAQVVGVDFSPRSIARAQAQAEAANCANLRFEVADLTETKWAEKYPSFDFILCHGVADYVLDPAALLQTLSNCLTTNGVLFMTANSPHHPAERIRTAFAALGYSATAFSDTPKQRALLQLTDQLMGEEAGIQGIGQAAKAYLDVDVFAPIAQHDSINTWCLRAKEAGLHFCGSMDAPVGLSQLSDEQLPLLYSLGRPALSIWMANLRQRPGMQLLFSRRPLQAPAFDKESLWEWQPKLASCVGTLPEFSGAPSRSRPITLRFQGLPDFVIYTTAYSLEVLRQCDGQKSLQALLNKLDIAGDQDHLRACLFRGYHFGVLTD